ncbi:glycine cleavage system protein H [Enterococcus cecorum]|jgi:glycine cleavage system H protein|uniref:Glycine cleavage H-protein n=1 Tax=Enterococcus cecorum TaxID=44008 RepID=A0A366SLK2_9ENTE|nr:glycine cleavage system protein H [Enterococcus cecorum]NLL33521.1 glycine cleavage system protein H [Enterococcus cecorum]RBR27372.1 glycine cleavage H-protein [Enterococcus cecorum]RBR27578.1 glycine cleavage H-protein [Enterococcus cecorum]RBR28795.1 glycine cleavage H-protein [Enterococcus cecorum]RBR32841.1 glycine cleavage H-protein [Enterococcus cecorum]
MEQQCLKHKDDLWILFNGKEYCVGLTKKAQDDLGKVTFASFPKVEAKVQAGMPVVEVEAEKAVCEFSSPLNGVVSSVNDQLDDLNAEDEMKAWLFSLKDVDPDEFTRLG